MFAILASVIGEKVPESCLALFYYLDSLVESQVETLSRRGETPVKMGRMLPHLRVYPDKKVAAFLVSGFQDGFHIPSLEFGSPLSSS